MSKEQFLSKENLTTTIFLNKDNYKEYMTSKKEGELAICYQKAFAGDPWYEVGKTKSGEFTSTPIGQYDQKHQETIEFVAYPTDEVIAKIRDLVENQNAVLCVEENQDQENLITSLYWQTNPQELFDKKYSQIPAMESFLAENIVDGAVYLDEIFTSFIRPKGNLWDIENNIYTIQKVTGTSQICFRTINKALLQKIQTAFPDCQIFDANTDIPDNRSFVIINS